MNIVDFFLGFLAAAGGLVDISNIVFNPQAAALFGYSLLWATVVGVIGAALYAEMCGRVAAIAKKSVFDLVKERMGANIAFLTLLASLFLNILTCAAEAGGAAILLQLLFGFSYSFMVGAIFILLLLVTWFMSFKTIEWFFSIVGLFIGIFALNVYVIHPDWHAVAAGFLPIVPHLPQSSEYFTYSYFVVGLISAALMPYEVYFYSSGGLEEKWSEKNLIVNYITAYGGYILGGIFALGISIVSTVLFFHKGIYPQLVPSALLAPAFSFGKIALMLTMLGLLFAFSGTAVQTALSGAYTLSQFMGWRWGKYQKPHGAPFFSITWIVILLLALVILSLGLNPMQLTQYAVVFSVVAFPFTYLPILVVANDKDYMKKYANGKIRKTLGWIFYGIIVVVAITAIPLLIITNGGNG